MKLMEMREGTHLVSADGNDLGKIERYVIDPSTRDVTHLVVEKGVVFPEEKVVPMNAVVPTSGDSETLTLDEAVDADDLPAFEERHYVDTSEEALHAIEAPPPPTAAWAYPIAPVGKFPHYPALAHTPVDVETIRNVPPASVILEGDTQVVAADGEDVGKVKEVGTDTTGHLAYLVIDPGLLTAERTIPEHWIDTVKEGVVRLAVRSETLRRFDRER